MLFFPRRLRRITQAVPEVEAGNGFISVPGTRSTLRELWQARHLVRQLMWRDLTVRYRQTWLGGLWAVLNPALNLALYYGMFGIMVRFNPPDYRAPYALVLLSGLVMWMIFSSTLNATSDSLLHNMHLLKKIYFPRTALTVAATGVSLVDFTVAVLILVALLPLLGMPLSPTRLAWLPVCGLLAGLAGWGGGCAIAVAKLRFRDVRHLVPLVMQALFYATPVVWTPGLLPARLQVLMPLNPLYGITELFRYALVGGLMPAWPSMLWATVGSLLLALAGYGLFIRYEARVTDRE